MITRYGQHTHWVTPGGAKKELTSLNSIHLMDILNSVMTNPRWVVMTMVADIERETFKESYGYIPNESETKKAIDTVTSMSRNGILAMTTNCRLVSGIKDVLLTRGVNVNSFIELIKEEQENGKNKN